VVDLSNKGPELQRLLTLID